MTEDASHHDPVIIAGVVTRDVVEGERGTGAGIRVRAGDVESLRGGPALPAGVVDATGAGDVFAAALILAVRAGEDVAGRLAAACAAACVERRGAASLPARAELEARAGIAPGPAGDSAQGDRP